jgi:ubiquinol-cytochrome c reductase iron-sulfur subunit
MADQATETIVRFAPTPTPSAPQALATERRPPAEAAAPAHDGPRRDFLKMTLTATAFVGICMAVWPFLDTMDPSHIAVTSTDVTINLGGIAAGSGATVVWKGQPILIRHRTQAEITRDRNTDILLLRDPATDAARVKSGHADWVVLIGTGPDGCVVAGNGPADPRGSYGGWVSPCDGSQYDTAGRVRSGPAKANLIVPPYDFSSANTITIG